MGLPHVEGSLEKLDGAFPADFISEAIDQTLRSRFYSLLMIATLVFDEEAQQRLGLSRVREYPLPYKTCIARPRAIAKARRRARAAATTPRRRSSSTPCAGRTSPCSAKPTASLRSREKS
ncbi:MAG: hypothetical protein R3B07_35290 [Polyangiaceae bacterium]